MIRQYSIDHNIFISDIKFLAALIFFFALAAYVL